LVSQVDLSHGVATIVAAQAKEGFYYNQYLTNQFFSLAIEVFGAYTNKRMTFFIDAPT
jgi:hypothetical protein